MVAVSHSDVHPPAEIVAEARNLRITIGNPSGPAVVDGIDLEVRSAETLCIVGESGCGKSLTALALMGLTSPPVQICADRLAIAGQELPGASERQLRQWRGSLMSMIFQEPMTSLNPAYRVGNQIAEMIRSHQPLSAAAARTEAIRLLGDVGIAEPALRARAYPHQLSGGMRQRVMIAMALANRPRLLIADEPTTALDVTIQRQILALINRSRQETGTSVVLITHDLGVVAQIADRVAVMYAGRLVETAPVVELFTNPQHPYTLGLLASVPRQHQRGERLVPIEGSVPALEDMADGCRFANRCPFAEQRCHAERPPRMLRGPDHEVECWKPFEALQ